MIFVTLGSQKFPFDRLLQKLDEMIAQGAITDRVLAQTGSCTYAPRHFEAVPFMDRQTFASYMAQADMVITHGGTGAIMGGVKNGKKVIAIPRRPKYGEHVDDHQQQIVEQFGQLGLIEPCFEVEQLPSALENAKTATYRPYESSSHLLLEDLSEYLESVL